METLKIRRVSQLGIGADYGKGDCGMACLSMILDYHGISATVDELGKRAGYSGGYLITDSIDMSKVARQYGIDYDWSRFVTTELVRDELDKGRPVTALVWYQSLPKKYDFSYRNNHWIVLTGYNDEGFFYHDPYWPASYTQGVHEFITTAQFKVAWKNIHSNYGSTNGVMFTNSAIFTEPEVTTSLYDEIVYVRYWLEQATREIESGNYERAREINLSLLDSRLYPLEFKLKEMENGEKV